jgi:hypothetical protein
VDILANVELNKSHGVDINLGIGDDTGLRVDYGRAFGDSLY